MTTKNLDYEKVILENFEQEDLEIINSLIEDALNECDDFKKETKEWMVVSRYTSESETKSSVTMRVLHKEKEFYLFFDYESSNMNGTELTDFSFVIK